MDARGHVLSERCIDDEIPFEIPESWEWTRLASLIELISGVDLSPRQYNAIHDGIPYLTGASNFDNGTLIENRWTCVPRRIAMRGDLLFTCKGTVGEMAINKFEEAHIARQIMAIRPIDVCALDFIELFLASMVEKIKTAARGVIPGIERSTLLDACVSIPPLAEQERIVKRIKELVPYVNEYGALESAREALDSALPECLRKSVLQMAVEGKLVPQNPDDEPAFALLDRIREERARLIKEKKIKAPKGGESVIYRASDGGYYEKRIDTKGRESEPICIDDEIPFEIPESWKWARLETLCDFGACVNTEYAKVDEGVWNLDLEDLEKDTGRIVQKKRKAAGDRGSTKHIFKAGMVLYSKLRPYLNKVAIADEDGVCTPEILPLQFTGISSRYAQTVLMSPLFVEYAKAHSYGVKMPRLGTKDGTSFLVPVPPCAEQQRIVHEATRVMVVIG